MNFSWCVAVQDGSLGHCWLDTFGASQVDFIVGTETAKFLSVGCWSLISGTFRYYLCSSVQWTSCATAGPRLGYLDATFFLLQILFVWAAFWMLPYSRRRTRPRSASDPLGFPVAEHAPDEDESEPVGVPQQPPADSAAGATQASTRPGSRVTNGARAMLQRTRSRAALLKQYFNPRQGGIVRRMFWYLTVIIGLTVMLGVVAWVVAPTDWQLLATLFWIRCGFGLLSAPFVVFKIPVVSAFLVPARKTSYNEIGQTVLCAPQYRHAVEPDAPSEAVPHADAGTAQSTGAATPQHPQRPRSTQGPDSAPAVLHRRSWIRGGSRVRRSLAGAAQPSIPEEDGVEPEEHVGSLHQGHGVVATHDEGDNVDEREPRTPATAVTPAVRRRAVLAGNSSAT